MENNKKVKIKRLLTKGVAKVPVVMQMEALECGAASLAMICAYYNKWIPLEQIRKIFSLPPEATVLPQRGTGMSRMT